MKLGALLMPRTPAHVAEQARELEGEGFASIWSAQAMGRGFMMLDPFVALSVAAGATQKVTLGTAVLQLPLYHPTDLALKAMSLYQASNQRFMFGVGAGSTSSDYEIHGEDFANRFRAFDAKLASLVATMKDGTANGGHLGASGGPPLLFGTWGKNVVRAAQAFNGWIASGMHRTPQACAEALSAYRSAGGQYAVVSTIQILPDTDLGEMRDRLSGYAEAGFDEAVVMVLADVELAEVRRLVAE